MVKRELCYCFGILFCKMQSFGIPDYVCVKFSFNHNMIFHHNMKVCVQPGFNSTALLEAGYNASVGYYFE